MPRATVTGSARWSSCGSNRTGTLTGAGNRGGKPNDEYPRSPRHDVNEDADGEEEEGGREREEERRGGSGLCAVSQLSLHAASRPLGKAAGSTDGGGET
ncbi:hypothetical protein VTN49DRAFT_7882 [Thermomyces lanuginosus]|uniref:uncharacterized protein n=1 Tax=Thermomyces lanuginosus TaxID=5541 RepID=UPI003741FE2D